MGQSMGACMLLAKIGAEGAAIAGFGACPDPEAAAAAERAASATQGPIKSRLKVRLRACTESCHIPRSRSVLQQLSCQRKAHSLPPCGSCIWSLFGLLTCRRQGASAGLMETR